MMQIRRLLPLLLLVAWLPAQENRLDEREAAMEQRMRERAERAGKSRSGEGKGEERSEKEEAEAEALRNMTPEERLAHSVRNNASTFCRFVAAVKPAKILPGQTGVIRVSALMNGQAVLPSPAPMELIGAPRQGLATLGGLSFHPAELGRHAAGYIGRPVYDNYAVFEVPVTIAADAVIGTKQAVSLDLRFDIYDGVSAQAIGRFVDRVTTEVEVGLALDPAVQGGTKPASTPEAEASKAPVGTGATAGADRDAATEPTSRVIHGQDPVMVPQTAPFVDAAPVPDRESLPPPTEGGDLPLPVLLGGGGLLLAIVLMLARRK